jgi:hypothetical protein
MSSLSYLGSKVAPICMILAGSLASICKTLGGMAGPEWHGGYSEAELP